MRIPIGSLAIVEAKDRKASEKFSEVFGLSIPDDAVFETDEEKMFLVWPEGVDVSTAALQPLHASFSVCCS